MRALGVVVLLCTACAKKPAPKTAAPPAPAPDAAPVERKAPQPAPAPDSEPQPVKKQGDPDSGGE